MRDSVRANSPPLYPANPPYHRLTVHRIHLTMILIMIKRLVASPGSRIQTLWMGS